MIGSYISKPFFPPIGTGSRLAVESFLCSHRSHPVRASTEIQKGESKKFSLEAEIPRYEISVLVTLFTYNHILVYI